jgi:hypothetical protein
MKEIKRLCDIGMLEWQPSSQWVLQTFIIPQKDSTVHTISDFRELNKCMVRKPYPIPKISTILQELEGFTYATALDLNMGYYTIRLDPTVSKMCTIIFPWGKYSYKRLPMSFGGLANIFQVQLMDLMASLEFVQAYMGSLLIIMRGILKLLNHSSSNRVAWLIVPCRTMKWSPDICQDSVLMLFSFLISENCLA